MPDTTENLLERVRAIMPDLAIEHFERNHEGLINDILIINHKFVFRFARTEEYARLLEVETKILDLIRPQVGISVPAPFYVSHGCMVYRLLSGQPLSRKTVMAFNESAQYHIAEQLGTFLHRLHNIDISLVETEIPSTRTYVKRQEWLEIRESVRDKIYPLLQNYQIEWVEDLFNAVLEKPDAFEYAPAFIHGDLASYHFLFDDQACKITGVFDFGMAGIGDPASDLGNLINIYGESFVQKMHKTYPDLDKYLPRARFYAQALELEWILRGLESGETFWFTAHLGSARDIQS